MANKPTLKGLVASLQPKGAKPTVLELTQSIPGPRPLASLLEGPLLGPSQLEMDLDWPEGREPRPYQAKGSVALVPLAQAQAPASELRQPKGLSPMERQRLNEAIAFAKAGKRLTLAQRKLLGKHELARIMVRLRPRGGDYG